MSFKSWLTGRDDKEADVYANFDKVDEVVTNIKNIQTNEVEAARDAVAEAINELNNVNGVSQYVGSVNVSGFESVFDVISSSVGQIADQMQAKADDIKAYSESKWYEKLGSSLAMAGAKIGEGILSVFEDIGDGVVSIVGWVAPKDSGVENWCKNFVEKEWAHDTFNFYYNSEFAKASTFTEQSGAASTFKIAGSIVGYMALGGAIAGAGETLAAAENASKVGKVGKAIGTFAQSTTRTNTVLAALGGMGSGTESGLKTGLDFDAAAWKGAKQGAVQGAIAYGAGKLGEHMQKSSAVKAAEGEVADAENALKAVQEQAARQQTAIDKAQEAFDSATDAASRASALAELNALESGMSSIDDAVSAAEQAVEAANAGVASAQTATYQGYTDAITRKGQEVGAKAMQNVVDNGIIKGTLVNAKSVLTAGAATVKNGAQSAANGIKNVATHPIDTVKNAAGEVANGAKSAASGLKNAVTHPIQTGQALVKGVAEVATNPATPGVVAEIANATGRELVETSANQQFNGSLTITRPIDTAVDDAGNPVEIYTDVDYTDGRDPFVTDDTANSTDTTDTTSTDTTPNNPQTTQTPSYPGTTGTPSTATTPVETTPAETTPVETTPAETTPAETTPAETTPVETTPAETTPAETTPAETTPAETAPAATTTAGVFGNDTTSGDIHVGGEYNEENGFISNEENGIELDGLEEIEDIIDENTTSIDDIVQGNKYTKLPTSSAPITSGSKSTGSTIIPIAAGLSAAAAAGIGAKAYMDRKKNNDNGEDDEFYSDEWDGDEEVEISYDDASDSNNYLENEDDYSYQAMDNEKYGARTNAELADIQ